MARPHSVTALVLFVLLAIFLGGCGLNARRYPPDYDPPAKRTDAARELHKALLRGNDSMRNIDVTIEELTWDEPAESEHAAAPGVTEVHRSLLFAAVTSVTRPVFRDGGWWISVGARGGDLTLRVADPDLAARAVAALKGLCPAVSR